MSFWSKDGKRVLRSQSRIPRAPDETEMHDSQARDEERAKLQHHEEKKLELPKVLPEEETKPDPVVQCHSTQMSQTQIKLMALSGNGESTQKEHVRRNVVAVSPQQAATVAEDHTIKSEQIESSPNSAIPTSADVDVEMKSIRARTGTPIPIECVSFGHNDPEYSEDVGYDENDGMSSTLSFPQSNPAPHFGYGQPYPAPVPRYWKPGAAKMALSGKKRKNSTQGFAGYQNVNKKQKMGPTSATQVLNETYSGLEYKFGEPSGEPHCRIFTVTVSIPPDGTEFTATGRSKKIAKNNLAELVLNQLNIPLPEIVIPSNNNERPEPESFVRSQPPVAAQAPTQQFCTFPNVDFASDDILDICMVPVPTTEPLVAAPNCLHRLKNIVKLDESAVQALNILLIPESPIYDFISEEGQPHDKTFTTELHFMDQNKLHQTFTGRGGSKKKSKLDAAKQALINMLGPSLYDALVQRSYGITEKRGRNVQQATSISMEMDLVENFEPNSDQYNTVFANRVRSLVLEKYDDVMSEKQAYLPQKVLAGVVMTCGFPLIDNCTVVAVTTGTKCIEGDFMSPDGLSLNDCHAEILATRCLHDFFYSQLEELSEASSEMEEVSNETNIFEVVKEGENGIEKFKLKEGVNFHLYISTSPCGDARIFSPKGLECEENELEPPGDEITDTHPNRSNRGVLRSKIEAAEGTIPVANLNKGPQTWDGVLQGNALHTMSCSDKVCRWNVVGVQGALLSNFLDPIYYSSIVLGSLHHPIHLERAVYGRVEKLENELRLPFKLNRPKLLMVSNEMKRQVKKSPNHAMAWTSGWSTPEILMASKGRCLEPEIASRLAKRMQFLRFLKIYKNRSGRRDNFAEIFYSDAKRLATEFQTALEQFKESFKAAGLGAWISKPVEQDSFRIGK